MENDNKIKGNDFQGSDFFKVILELKENVLRSLHVSDVGVVKKTDSTNKEYLCSLVSDPDKVINCLYLGSETINESDIVIILYTDVNINMNLKKLLNNEPIQKVTTNKHSINNGLIIQIL